MNKALLDTDIYSEVLKAIDSNVARNANAYRCVHRNLTFSVITVMEIIQGLQKVGASPKRIQAFRNATVPEEILLFDQAAADWRADRRRSSSASAGPSVVVIR